MSPIDGANVRKLNLRLLECGREKLFIIVCWSYMEGHIANYNLDNA